MEPGQFLLFSGILLVALLLLLGGAIVTLRSRRRGEASHEDRVAQERASAPSAEPAAAPRSDLANRLGDWQRKLPPDAVLLSRDAPTGEWIVELEGQRYRRLSDIHDDRAAAKILSAIEGVKRFAGLTPAEPAAPASAPPVPSASGPAAAPAATTPRKAGSGLASYPAPEGSIIAQIETLLQRELTLHPDLLDRNIHMGATSDGSLLIEIDHTFYKSPNDVPDPKVREAVLRAVRTWEKSG